MSRAIVLTNNGRRNLVPRLRREFCSKALTIGYSQFSQLHTSCERSQLIVSLQKVWNWNFFLTLVIPSALLSPLRSYTSSQKFIYHFQWFIGVRVPKPTQLTSSLVLPCFCINSPNTVLRISKRVLGKPLKSPWIFWPENWPKLRSLVVLLGYKYGVRSHRRPRRSMYHWIFTRTK